jgi:hypothetical protein
MMVRLSVVSGDSHVPQECDLVTPNDLITKLILSKTDIQMADIMSHTAPAHDNLSNQHNQMKGCALGSRKGKDLHTIKRTRRLTDRRRNCLDVESTKTPLHRSVSYLFVLEVLSSQGRLHNGDLVENLGSQDESHGLVGWMFG